jgi:DNA modification methylase
MPEPTNLLYYGDNLDVLRRHVGDDSVDLVYLDPPFKSDQTYNLLFREHDETKSQAQIKVFEDTWEWDEGAALAFEETVEHGGRVADALVAFRAFLGETDMLAYLCMMAPRLVELRRVMKATASIYLHCDPTASHYLKMLMDAVFGPERFLNEITWKRSSAHSDTKQGMRRCGRIHDILLLYTKTTEYIWNPLYTPYTEAYLASEYRHVGPDKRRYKETDVTAAKPGGDTEYEWHVKRTDGSRWEADLSNEYKDPKAGWEYKAVLPYEGRFWAYSKTNMADFARAGQLIHRRTGMPRLVQFADEMPGIPLQDFWDDISPESGSLDLGYPTQKPETLLDRILQSSSNEGATVLDPFCGCGTAIASAQKLKRRWIGIDITHLAIALIRHRLTGHEDAYGTVAYEVIGEPVDLSGAETLAAEDPHQFQWWAIGKLGARPAEPKKGADRGIDGRLYFHDEEHGPTKQIIFSVKAGHTGPTHLRDLRGVIEREHAQIGVFITMQDPTREMRREAASAGFYDSPVGKHQRLQILTVSELLSSKGIDYPSRLQRLNVTFKQAPRAAWDAAHKQGALPLAVGPASAPRMRKRRPRR